MSKDKEVLLNDEITADEVRCIGDDGHQYGIISLQEALAVSEKVGLDLVLIAPEANPPVCKVMDYGKFKYQEEKKQKEAKKKQKVIDIKEIKFSIKIAPNDISYKVKHAIEFLEEGKYVKLRVFLKGREMANPEAGVELLKQIIPMLDEAGIVEKEPMHEGRNVDAMVVPRKDKKKK